MANMMMLFRGTEEEIVKAMEEFYNRQGFIGNTVANAKVLTYADGSIGVSVPYSGDKIDDGRELDGMEERKHFLIYRTDGTDTTPVDAFIKEHTEAGDEVSRVFVMTVGNDTLYFAASCKIVKPVYDENGEGEDEEIDDWTPSGTPTVSAENKEEGEDENPFNF